MDRRGVVPDEERLVALAHLIEVLQRFVGYFLVNRYHAGACQRPRVLDFLHPDLSIFRIDRWVIHCRRPSMQHSARAKLVFVSWILLSGIIEFLRFLLGVQMIEIAEPFIKSMD